MQRSSYLIWSFTIFHYGYPYSGSRCQIPFAFTPGNIYIAQLDFSIWVLMIGFIFFSDTCSCPTIWPLNHQANLVSPSCHFTYSQLFIIVTIDYLRLWWINYCTERKPNGLKQNDSQDREIMNTKKMRYVWFLGHPLHFLLTLFLARTRSAEMRNRIYRQWNEHFVVSRGKNPMFELSQSTVVLSGGAKLLECFSLLSQLPKKDVNKVTWTDSSILSKSSLEAHPINVLKQPLLMGRRVLRA